MKMITLLPTLNRVRLLQNFLQSAIEGETTTPGLIIVDRDDWEKNKETYKIIVMPAGWEYCISQAVRMGDKIREVYPMIQDYDAINILNDDHVIKTKGWDLKLLSKIDGTNFVTCSDGWMSPRKASGATVFSKGLLDAVGIPIYPPGMQHLFIDDLWEGIGYGTGCWVVDHSVLIEHHNQLRTPDKRDSTFNVVYGSGPDLTQHPLWQNDQKVYQEFMKNDYVSVRNRVRALRGMIEIK